MATKDWKVFDDNDTVKSWVKPGKDSNNPHLSGGKVVGVLPALGEWVDGKWKNAKDWAVEIDESGYSKDKKIFKTKSQALAYAKQYMRTH